jgi:hypothetical protein
MRERFRTQIEELRSSEEQEAHPEANELARAAGGGRECGINDGRASRYRARRGRLGASQLAWLDEEDDGVLAELQRCSSELRDACSSRARARRS